MAGWIAPKAPGGTAGRLASRHATCATPPIRIALLGQPTRPELPGQQTGRSSRPASLGSCRSKAISVALAAPRKAMSFLRRLLGGSDAARLPPPVPRRRSNRWLGRGLQPHPDQVTAGAGLLARGRRRRDPPPPAGGAGPPAHPDRGHR